MAGCEEQGKVLLVESMEREGKRKTDVARVNPAVVEWDGCQQGKNLEVSKAQVV